MKKLSKEQALDVVKEMRMLTILKKEARERRITKFMLKNGIKCCPQCGLMQE